MSKNNNLSGGLFAHKPTPLTIKETSLSAQIAEWLTARNIYNDRLQCGIIKTTSGNWMKLCKRGTPDRFAIIDGQIIFIEVKSRGAKCEPEQIKKHDELRMSGAIIVVCDSFDNFREQFTAVRLEVETRNKGGVNLYD